MQGSSAPNVLSYTVYSDFLEDAYKAIHEKDPGFTYAKIAELGRLKSRTYVRNIIQGIQDPTEDELKEIAQCLRLNSEDTNYLISLFHFNRCKDSAAVFDLFQHLVQVHTEKQIKKNPFREIEIQSSFLHLTLLSMCEWEGFQPNPDSIATKLKSQFSTDEIRAAWEDLLAHGYVRWCEKKERYEPAQSYVKKLSSQPNFFLRRFHRQCLKHAEAAIDGQSMADRYLVSSSIAVPAASYGRMVQKINDFIDNLVRSEKFAEGKDNVVQVNIQIFRTASEHQGFAFDQKLSPMTTEMDLAPQDLLS